MDINIGETPAGRLKMELFSDIVPKSVHARYEGEYGLIYRAQDSRELPSAMHG